VSVGLGSSHPRPLQAKLEGVKVRGEGNCVLHPSPIFGEGLGVVVLRASKDPLQTETMILQIINSAKPIGEKGRATRKGSKTWITRC
jgi:hypothetical protein